MIILLMLTACKPQQQEKAYVITSDVTNFWNAYDKIIGTRDSALQYKYLDSLFFNKATAGQKAMWEVRNYTAKEYVDAINNYPKFWNSIRKNTLKAKQFEKEFEQGIAKLRVLYPALKPVKIYFTVGVFRSGGTTLDSLVLIGSELAMTDKNTVVSEFPETVRTARRTFFDSNPIDDLVLLNIHEYVHTQQKPMVHNLLSLAIYEGVAEFVSTQAMNVPSVVPAVPFGKNNQDSVREKFEQEMFYINNRPKWLWSDAKNDFGVRDLGYYIGYQMSENYYEQAADKAEAIKYLIELDYENEAEMEEFVESTNFFSASLDELYTRFEEKRPYVSSIKQFQNKSENVDPNIGQITIEFSEPLNGLNTGVDYGPMGETAFPNISFENRIWMDDNQSWQVNVSLAPNKQYQFLISNNFRTEAGIPLKPYLIEFKTRDTK